MEISAREESHPWSVLFLLHVLSLFSAENDLSTGAIVADTLSTSMNNFVVSGTVSIRSFWAKKTEKLSRKFTFIPYCLNYIVHQYLPLISQNLAYFDRLCTFLSSKHSDISLNFAQSNKPRKASSPK